MQHLSTIIDITALQNDEKQQITQVGTRIIIIILPVQLS